MSSERDPLWRELFPETDTMPSNLDLAIAKLQKDLPECLAVSLVDLAMGVRLSTKTIDTHAPFILDLLAAATAETLQGPTVQQIEQKFREVRGHKEDGAHYIRQAHFETVSTQHFLSRLPKNENLVLVVVCSLRANFGIVRSKIALELPKIETAAG